MEFNFRKRIKIAPGVSINIGKREISTSVGGRAGSLNFGKKGSFFNAGILNTGLSYRKKVVTPFLILLCYNRLLK